MTSVMAWALFITGALTIAALMVFATLKAEPSYSCVMCSDGIAMTRDELDEHYRVRHGDS